ncbi:polysaccharide deacetylase family protein [Clostridium butyricum]|uniref:Polysaccharide deacetylase n=1 Tax=Clostridium butyricum E4 str. BoNT E BL5262 TaxID=632245 RepID=C4IDV5_CLOBU|nr:polysaccharide deacetylase family protein [Clostridium butyricum]EDT75251.1 polysaccharide deacetylase family protein [Clostridium butyricum 5521]EEP55613.1 polysaccharide deacetylase [Clostridium butyricum E4 str. BoNT E BL5262]NFL32385.1 polysaccharide deacetylase [Clostridium butyricum]NFS18838.1 polysaccharide deacetylase [Clostridium butyricum]
MYLKKLKKLTLFSLIITMFFSIPIYNTYADEKNNVESNSKVVYLTFDDGPAGKVTNDVLDILKNNSVHATFFLIGCQIKDQENLVKRIYDEGNSIGLHSMTHKKNSLYCSNEQFLKEMISTQELISTVVPIKPTILRFPFGCNNNTYKISKSMVDLLHDNNLKIYDWNTDSGDGANPNSAPSTIFKNAKSTKDRVILLMHCSYLSKNTVKALPSIIQYYKDNGYEFKTIDENTPEEFHFMKK